ncbi:MAG: hypothetical protein JXA50_01695 [Deltaproteobacteria bacterium]|nr:hypothetical protein [Deltaproteobacteria bacterium]
METLNEQDLDWLTNTENRLIRMRKREAANTNSRLIIDSLTETIKEIHELRQWLQSRFGLEMDKSIR